jgi:hypothetical protein
MSKVIGVTPGPVKYEVADREDLANFKEFNPANEGAEGDVLIRAENGTYEWASLQDLLDRINSGE